MGRRRWMRVALAVAVVVAAGFGVRLACRAAPVEVRTARIGRGPVEATLSNTSAGTVRARVRSRLSVATAGSVVEIAVQRGSRVARGDLLVRLESATQAAQVAVAERALETARAAHARACVVAARAERELTRNTELARANIVAEDVLDRLRSVLEIARADCSVNEAEVAHSAAALDLARTELEKTVLRAPYDAIVAEVPVQLGEWVSPSVPLVSAPTVIDLIDPSSIYVGAPMDEVDAARLAPGARARVTIDPYPGRTFDGRVVRVAPYVLDVERQNRTVEIEVELDDVAFARTLLPGTSADVELVLEVRPDCVRVPAAALLAGKRVLVLADGVLDERAPELGLANWQWAEVRSGLAPGDEVVTSLELAEARSGARARRAGAAP